MEGIKGYKTIITHLKAELLVARYKELWRIEQSFRIAKSDLEARPIYHRKETSIQYHVLIVFVALCMARAIEFETGKSIKQVVDDLRDKWTLTLTDEISGNSVKIQLDQKPHKLGNSGDNQQDTANCWRIRRTIGESLCHW